MSCLISFVWDVGSISTVGIFCYFFRLRRATCSSTESMQMKSRKTFICRHSLYTTKIYLMTSSRQCYALLRIFPRVITSIVYIYASRVTHFLVRHKNFQDYLVLYHILVFHGHFRCVVQNDFDIHGENVRPTCSGRETFTYNRVKSLVIHRKYSV